MQQLRSYNPRGPLREPLSVAAPAARDRLPVLGRTRGLWRPERRATPLGLCRVHAASIPSTERMSPIQKLSRRKNRSCKSGWLSGETSTSRNDIDVGHKARIGVGLLGSPLARQKGNRSGDHRPHGSTTPPHHIPVKSALRMLVPTPRGRASTRTTRAVRLIEMARWVKYTMPSRQSPTQWGLTSRDKALKSLSTKSALC